MSAQPVVAAEEQEIREAAIVVLDGTRPFEPKAVDSILVRSDVERQFASEMLKAMRAEAGMFRRAAAAVGGNDRGESVRRIEESAAATRRAILAAKPMINGDAATMTFEPGGGRGTTLEFRKADGGWRLDLLRGYRERGQIDAKGIAKWKKRQRAAEVAAKIYEDGDERDLAVLPVLYEGLCADD